MFGGAARAADVLVARAARRGARATRSGSPPSCAAAACASTRSRTPAKLGAAVRARRAQGDPVRDRRRSRTAARRARSRSAISPARQSTPVARAELAAWLRDAARARRRLTRRPLDMTILGHPAGPLPALPGRDVGALLVLRHARAARALPRAVREPHARRVGSAQSGPRLVARRRQHALRMVHRPRLPAPDRRRPRRRPRARNAPLDGRRARC